MLRVQVRTAWFTDGGEEDEAEVVGTRLFWGVRSALHPSEQLLWSGERRVGVGRRSHGK